MKIFIIFILSSIWSEDKRCLMLENTLCTHQQIPEFPTQVDLTIRKGIITQNRETKVIQFNSLQTLSEA